MTAAGPLQEARDAATAKAIVQTFHDLPPLPKPAPVKNTLVFEADLKNKKPRRVDGKRWLAHVREAAHARLKGDVLATAIVRVAELLSWAVDRGAGIGRIAFKVLGELAGRGAGKDTSRKAARYLEDWGLLKTANVMVRRGNKLRRTVNAYELVLPEDGTPKQREREPTASRNIWWEIALGLHARARGVNRTPLRPRPAET